MSNRGCSHENFVVHCEIKARPRRCVITDREWELPTGSSVIITRLNLPCTEAGVQHGTGLKVMLLVRSTAWPFAFPDSLLHGSLVLTVQWSQTESLQEPIKAA